MKPLLNRIFWLVLLFSTACGSPGTREEYTAGDTAGEASEEVPATPAEVTAVPLETGKSDAQQALDWSSQTKANSPQKARVTRSPAQAVAKSGGAVATQNMEREMMLEMAQSKKLAVYCPRNMVYKETSDVIGFVADLIDDDLIKDAMGERLANASDQSHAEVNDSDMLIRELKMYQFIELRLNDSDNQGFLIKAIHDEDIQQINANMEGWHWKITPTSSDEQQQLVLKVIVYDNQQERIASFDKTYKIDVKIASKRFLRNTWALFVDNPEWAFATIIIPVLTFLWGRYQAVRSRKRKLTVSEED